MAGTASQQHSQTSRTLDLQVLEELTDYVATDKFLHTLESVRTQRADIQMTALPQPPPPQTLSQPSAPLIPSSAASTTEFAASSSTTSDCDYVMLEKDDFIVLDRDDAVEAIAYYIALFVARTPEAQRMEPRQLHEALQHTFKGLQRSKFRLVWDWGRYLYRWSAMAYSMVRIYENPWLVRVVVRAMWASGKLAVGLLL